ncbi:MAG: hypothetical protein J0G30_11120 [Actinomycetales bacterium]|nr:hypothetical protein [Actinomycetales bacterium]
MTEQEPLWDDPSPEGADPFEDAVRQLLGEVPHPVNWRTLSAEEAEVEWLELNAWVDWLRAEYGLPSTIIPPYWHRHPELVWELSAIHVSWQGAYDPQAAAGAAAAWHLDFRMARERLREWVSLSGTKLDQDRPTRRAVWPGDEPSEDAAETPNPNRHKDFVAFVMADVRRRAREEAEQSVDGPNGELNPS